MDVRRLGVERFCVADVLSGMKKIIPWLIVSCALVVFYILSSGPAVYLQRKHIISPRVIVVVYFPLTFAEHHCAPFDAYLNWWFSAAKRTSP
jgi:hypothetical protein